MYNVYRCLFQAQTLAIPESIIMEMNETCVVGEGKGREGKGREGLGKEEVEMHAQASKQTSC